MSHAAFIAISYGFCALFAGGLMLWIALDHRAQSRRLDEIDPRRTARETADHGG